MRNFYQILVLLLVFSGVQGVYAQCLYQGTVVDVSAFGSCERVILTKGGEVLELESNLFGLEAGDKIRFNYSELAGSMACFGTPVVLNCVEKLDNGNGNPCDASFGFSILSADNNEVVLYPQFALPGLYEYHWDIAGNYSCEEMSPVYAFSEPGLQEVCLTVITPEGCETMVCQTINTENDNADVCGGTISLALDNGLVFGQVFNVINPATPPSSVNWTALPGGELLGNDPVLALSLSPYLDITEICVDFEVAGCAGQICKAVSSNPTCQNPAQINTGITCPTESSPVCGCDGNTYNNACEAINWFGVTSFVQGPCPSGSTGPFSCLAYFEYEKTSDFTAICTNASLGNYANIEWAVSGISQGTTEEIELENLTEGLYKVCIQISGGTGDCESSYCQEIYIGLPSNLCNYTDCVWPGDSDGNGKANVYDMLDLGVGYGAAGVYRPEGSIQWQGQYAPDWGMSTIIGNDYKHLDYNGDGQIEESDINAIDLNYAPSQVGNQIPVSDRPMVYLEFENESVVFDQNSPDEVVLTANIIVGSADKPVVGLHGIAFQIVYPQIDIVLPHSANIDLASETFFGFEEHILSFDQDIYPLKRVDGAFSRKGGSSISGHGPIGTADFIVVSDIIGGRADDEIPIVLTLEGLRMVDANGDPLDYNLSSEPALITIINNIPTSTIEPGLQSKWSLLPNPASNEIYLQFGELDTDQIRIQNLNGQAIYSQNIDHNSATVDVSDWPSGLYLVELISEAGRSVKKLIID